MGAALLLGLGSLAAAARPTPAASPPPAGVARLASLAAQATRDAAALTEAVGPWTEALDRASAALGAGPPPALEAAGQALARARAAWQEARPRRQAAAASFAALRREANRRRTFPPEVLAAASAFRGAEGAYLDREARQARLEEALARARTAPATPRAPAGGG